MSSAQSLSFEMNVLLQGKEYPITMEMIQEVLYQLASQASYADECDGYQPQRLRA